MGIVSSTFTSVWRLLESCLPEGCEQCSFRLRVVLETRGSRGERINSWNSDLAREELLDPLDLLWNCWLLLE